MHLRRLACLAISLLVGIAVCSGSDTWAVREDGFGNAKIGMSLERLSAIFHEKFSTPKGAADDQQCFFVNPANHAHVSFMIENGNLARIEVDAAGILTADGIQVGDSEAHVLRVYGSRAKVQPNAYTGPEGHYVTVRSKNRQYGIRFMTEKGRVESFYAGSFKAIQYIEGCE
jgi:hypothetical protein